VKQIQDGGQKSKNCNGLTDQHKIWQDNTYWASEPSCQVKFAAFKNPRWWTAAIFNNQKFTISAQRFDQSARNLAR